MEHFMKFWSCFNLSFLDGLYFILVILIVMASTTMLLEASPFFFIPYSTPILRLLLDVWFLEECSELKFCGI